MPGRCSATMTRASAALRASAGRRSRCSHVVQSERGDSAVHALAASRMQASSAWCTPASPHVLDTGPGAPTWPCPAFVLGYGAERLPRIRRDVRRGPSCRRRFTMDRVSGKGHSRTCPACRPSPKHITGRVLRDTCAAPTAERNRFAGEVLVRVPWVLAVAARHVRPPAAAPTLAYSTLHEANVPLLSAALSSFRPPRVSPSTMI